MQKSVLPIRGQKHSGWGLSLIHIFSSLPANNAEEVSATGRIVLTFDAKVEIAEGTVATLGNKTLVPSVAGKTITFPYMGLDYNTTYTFTLPGNSVSDFYGNKIKAVSYTHLLPIRLYYY